MAALTEEQRRKLVRQLQGMNLLVAGSLADESMLGSYPDSMLETLLSKYKTLFDANTVMETPPVPATGELTPFTGDAPLPVTRTKDYLKGIIERQLNGGNVSSYETTALESALSTANYADVVIDASITPEEQGLLAGFMQDLNDDKTLTQIFAENQAKQEEAARLAALEAERQRIAEENRIALENAAEEKRLEMAQLQTDTQMQVSSLLVYSGYLKPENAGNNIEVARAMKTVMAINTPYNELPDVEKQVFANFNDWSLNFDLNNPADPSFALTYLQTHLPEGMMPQNETRTGSLLEEHLESGDPKLVEIAQGYLGTKNPDVHVTGTIDKATHDTAVEELQAPLTVPPGLFDANGNVRMDNMLEMAARGQLYLPISKLEPDDQLLVKELPLAANRGPGDPFSQERFLAIKLIAERGPEGYAEILKEENDRRANAELNVDYVDLEAAAQENVAPVVAEVNAAEEAVDLPQDFASTAVAYAAKTGGVIDMSQIPAIIKLAESGGNVQIGLDQSLRDAENTMTLLGVEDPQAFLRTTVNLDPSSPTFQQDMETFLKHSYVMYNAHNTGADGIATQLDTIPADTQAKLQEIAAGQTTVSVTNVSAVIENLGLPANTFDMLEEASYKNIINLRDLPGALLSTKAPEYAGLDPNAPEIMLSNAHIEEGGGRQPEALQNIIDTGVLDLEDPAQLSLALQIAVALKDRDVLENVAGNADIVNKTNAAAQGYVGANANQPVETPEEPTLPEEAGAEVSSINDKKITVAFHAAGADGFDNLPVVENAPSIVPDDNTLPLKTKVASLAAPHNNIG